MKVIITGGGGFIGAYLVRKMVRDGYRVEVIDSLQRGDQSRLADCIDDIVLHKADIRDEEHITKICAGAELVIHMAAINGTENFYNRPDLVLDVGIRGMIAVANACKKADIPDLIVASSAEVYQSPATIPTPETAALMLPDSLNPRYSYGGSKIASELIALNYHREHFRKLQIFRPHNVYGPDMGYKHVLPQFIQRAIALAKAGNSDFELQGDGSETRAFCFVDDIVNGILTMYKNGGHREIYHIGNDEEVPISALVSIIGDLLGTRFEIKPSAPAEGSTHRRCPDISKMRALGYNPMTDLKTGVPITFDWYKTHDTNLTGNALL